MHQCVLEARDWTNSHAPVCVRGKRLGQQSCTTVCQRQEIGPTVMHYCVLEAKDWVNCHALVCVRGERLGQLSCIGVF